MKKQIEKTQLLLMLLLLPALLLTGCGKKTEQPASPSHGADIKKWASEKKEAVDSFLYNKAGRWLADKQDNLAEDEEYRVYTDLQTRGELTAEGTVALPAAIDAVCVSFGENPMLLVQYYADAEKKNSLQPQEGSNVCLLQPGDRIYAEAASRNDRTAAELYQTDYFRIISFDAGKNIIKITEKRPSPDPVFIVPKENAAASYSILPVGKYAERQIHLTVYDSTGGNNTPIDDFTWTINGTPAAGTDGSCDPLKPYTVRCSFDAEKYYYANAIPDAFTKDPQQTGTVEFAQQQPQSSVSEFKVYLRSSINLMLPEKGIYGSFSYSLDGDSVKQTNPVTVGKTQKLSVTYEITQDGYCFAPDPDASEEGEGIIVTRRTANDIPLTFAMNNKKLDPEAFFSVIPFERKGR